ncbi:MAG TPA: hypothetical protein VH079_16850 [Terriglobales bacterium]|nr:hypothetical protein [Terriglobales bacterium]
MHAWEGNPKLDESSEYRSEALAPERTRTKAGQSHSFNWRVVAVLAGGFLLGVPFLATGTLHAAWAQLSHAFASMHR